ncbi:MAG: hypothetical protein ACFFE5_16200 [Candidatus Thorarchaeota archaeon]
MREKILKIRNHLIEIKEIKEEIINYLNNLKKLDDTTKNLWISDIKELYYNVFTALEFLNPNLKLGKEEIVSSKNNLYTARNLLSKIISELKIFKNNKSSDFIIKVEKTFRDCWDAFWYVYENISNKKLTEKNIEKVIIVSDLEYHLPCSKCGKIAVEFKIGYGRFDEKEALVFRGITHERSMSIKVVYELFELLLKRNLLGVHNFMKKYHGYEGLDAYCPECNKIYCWEHYDAREEYDDGFYDCTYGICPRGHKRMIDD